ncbi:putative cation antiporter NADH dehydrogenase subunit [Pseudoclavibacter endophyticus]|uniref:Na+/H+ antiporter subunit D n=1 Tax=Pseudoclavibacter endophyticus TaxID=1778590 RepID=A0A6H9WIZ6_9MICO|nr:Na+/H+ antiporter subunit D [Pseudoclavibacter endophyticus]KAB1649213.1 Na+/H+ antiporter subunit D [Pseudoclavibacter endophyticus]GGA64449.1 putative cation antiporter NADH dehydrogenase subunit [Pseudoclavibacter endophyticus]
MTWLVPLIVLVPLIGAAITLTAARKQRLQVAIASATMLIALAVSIGLLVAVHIGGETLVMQGGGWLAPFGISIVVDRLSAIMVVVSSIVLLCVMAFSIGQGNTDGDDETPVSIFYPTYLVLAAGVYNAFIAGDLFNLYVGFEILLVASFVLITLGGTAARIKAGVTYIIVSLVSSILFLAAVALIYGAVGTVNMAEIAVRVAELPHETQTVLHMSLLIAFGIKAALFPLSFWLPDSYPSAPAPVTAVFAGLLTKVGVYAILRTESLLFASNDINTMLLIIAMLTMIVGILGAVAQAGIRRMLSFTLVSHIGYMIFGISLGSAAGWSATVYYIAHHIIVQTTLFLVTGLIERVAGTSSITHLGGMLKRAPLVALLFFVPMLNLGGIPPFSGFIGKVGLFTAGGEVATPLIWAGIGVGALTSLLTLYALIRVWNLGFWRPQDEVEDFESALTGRVVDTPESARMTETRDSSRLMTGATATLVAVTVALTVFAGPIYELAQSAAENLHGGSGYIDAVDPQTPQDAIDDLHDDDGDHG